MFDFVRKSLRNKLLVVFIGIGFLPFLTLLIYAIFLSEAKIVNNIIGEQLDRTKSVSKFLNNHLTSLSKEVSFLSSLDLMDDMLVDDIDKRISRLLNQKANDMGQQIKLMTVNMQAMITSSSDKESIHKEFNLNKLTENSGDYIEAKTFYTYSKIYASFDKKKELGYIVLEFNLENLDIYLTHDNNIHAYMLNHKNGLIIGEHLSLNLYIDKDEEGILGSSEVIVYKRIAAPMHDWYIVYAVDKSYALAYLYDFIRFMLYVSVLIFAFIIYASFYYARGIVKQIEELTAVADEIVNTKNYSIQLETTSKDEISILTQSFNKMIKTTSVSLIKLENENRLRLERFTQLIKVFNTIIQTKSEEECVKVSIEEISTLTSNKDLYFIEENSWAIDRELIKLYVSDFEKNEKVYFGSIALGIEKFEDKKERDFYNAIASMITLQLDKIRLIKRTLSVSDAKSAFISSMSHELRTHLNAIIGFAQFLITYEELTDDQIETVGNIESSAQYLLEMINEILDIAKIEAGKMEAQIQSVDILRIVQASCNMLSPLASEKDLNLLFNHDKIENTIYDTDPKMFQQIVLNLLSNSIKFTKEGNIVVELYEDDKTLYVSIKDNGIGISSEDLDRLFTDFTQVENVMQKTHKGTGLGLSLSKKMAKILGGDVILKSEGSGLGTESIFSIKKVSNVKV